MAASDQDARPGIAAVRDVLIACRHLRSPPGWLMITSLLPRYMRGERLRLFRSRKTLPERKRLHYILATRTAVPARAAVP